MFHISEFSLLIWTQTIDIMAALEFTYVKHLKISMYLFMLKLDSLPIDEFI